MKSVDAIVSDLRSMADPEYISKMEYFGIKGAPEALGIRSSYLKPYAKELGKNHSLALELWDIPIHECKHLAILTSEPKKLIEEVVEKWTAECYSWDLVDGLGMKIFPLTPFAFSKVEEWSYRESEYEKRMAFALMVGIVIRLKKEPDENIAKFFSIIERESWDDRNFVKKAVNWALRQIGKRNLYLNKLAIESAERIKSQDSKAARWIASDALRELKSNKIQARLLAKES